MTICITANGAENAAALHYSDQSYDLDVYTVASIDIQSGKEAAGYYTKNIVRSVYCTRYGLTAVEEYDSNQKCECLNIINSDGDYLRTAVLYDGSTFHEAEILCNAQTGTLDDYVFVAANNTLDDASNVYMVNVDSGEVEKVFNVSAMAKEIYL